MFRAWLDRRTTQGEWRQRHELDRDLNPGYFRKGRRAHGCPRFCVHCRMKKSRPTRQEWLATLTLQEWTTDAE